MTRLAYIKHIDPWFYPRQQLCTHISNMCVDTLFSRMVFLGSRRIGKSYFFLNDLSPELIERNLIPIYINAWGNKEQPHVEFAEQLATALDELTKEGAVKRFLNAEIRKFAIGSQFAKVEVEFQPIAATNVDLLNIKQLLKSVIEASGGLKIVLILDEFQHLSTSKVFSNFLYSLRTLLDTYGTLISVIYTGSSRKGIKAAFEDQDAPFYQSAQVSEFPIIDDGFVDHCVLRLHESYSIELNKIELLNFWQEIGHSPHWVINLMREIVANKRNLSTGISIIKDAIKIEENLKGVLSKLSLIDKAVLFLLSEGRGLYGVSSKEYIASVGGKWSKSKVQTSQLKLESANIITTLPNKKVIVEMFGLIDEINKQFSLLVDNKQ
ncbi:MAG: hypothetical protein HAW67_07420 [Endozoicomonadaceae bacterium]|nr:hypothetical protein [Endozoicomonadaceae bacterium]